MASSVPAPIFGPAGFIAPTEADILAGVQADINAAFGGNLNPALETPQGQLASSETAIIGSVNDTFLYFTNQVDPAFAEGRMQDAIARIYFIERNPSQPTVVQALCTGLPGVVIPAGAGAVASDGNRYTCTQTGTIGVGGTVTLPFACNVVGPIPCPAGTLITIYQSVPGWDAINNPFPGTLGNIVETRTAFEARRALSVAHNSAGSLPSILGAVLTVPNVIDAFVTENPTNSPMTIGGVVLSPNSIYVCVLGGNASAIAQAIWSKKAPGCGYTGNTSVTVQDLNSGYIPPYPSYSVSFQTPVSLEIFFSVVINSSLQVPANAAGQIQSAIIKAFAGLDGGPRARIASEILASRFYAPVAALGPWVQIISIEIGSTNMPSAVVTGSITGTTLTVTSLTSGALAVGQVLTDAVGAIIDGTKITALGTGTGGTGTYTVSAMQTVSSRAVVAVSAALFAIYANINQAPTVSAAGISVSLA